MYTGLFKSSSVIVRLVFMFIVVMLAMTSPLLYWDIGYESYSEFAEFVGIINSGEYLQRQLVAGFIVAFISFFISEVLALIRFNSMKQKLYTDCDPEAFIKSFEPRHKKCIKVIEKETNFPIFSCWAFNPLTIYALALFQNGDVKKSIEILNKELKFTGMLGKRLALYKVVARLNLCHIYFLIDDFTKYDELLDETGSLLNIFMKSSKPQIEMFRSKFYTLKNVQRGNYDKVIEYYLSRLDSCKFNYDIVISHCVLAKMYKKKGDNDLADMHIKKAFEIAPKFYLVNEVNKQLNS